MMLKMKKINFAWMLMAFMAVGCGNSTDQQNAGSAIEGLFGPSETEKANSKEREAQVEKLKNQADQMQKDRLDSYQ